MAHEDNRLDSSFVFQGNIRASVPLDVILGELRLNGEDVRLGPPLVDILTQKPYFDPRFYAAQRNELLGLYVQCMPSGGTTLEEAHVALEDHARKSDPLGLISRS